MGQEEKSAGYDKLAVRVRQWSQMAESYFSSVLPFLFLRLYWLSTASSPLSREPTAGGENTAPPYINGYTRTCNYMRISKDMYDLHSPYLPNCNGNLPLMRTNSWGPSSKCAAKYGAPTGTTWGWEVTELSLKQLMHHLHLLVECLCPLPWSPDPRPFPGLWRLALGLLLESLELALPT